MKANDENRYDDIINLPRHISATRPHMSIYDRAAQFAPFAALTGHAAAINETARLTDRKIDLDEYSKALLDEKLQYLYAHLEDSPTVSITYYQPDTKKSGGVYVTAEGILHKIDLYTETISLKDDIQIPIPDILEIRSDILSEIL